MFGSLYSEGMDDAPRRTYSDVSLLFGGQLALAVKEENLRGEYVDMLSLFHTEPHPVPKAGNPVWNQEVVRKWKIDKN